MENKNVRIIKATTKNGIEYEVRITLLPSLAQKTEILLQNGNWYGCRLTSAKENGVYVDVVNVDAKYLRKSGIDIPKNFTDVNIRVEPFEAIVAEMKQGMEELLKVEAEKVVFERFAFSYHTSYNFFAVRWLCDDADPNLRAYNPTIQRIENALKYLKMEDLTEFQTSFYLWEYSTEYAYEMSLLDFEPFFTLADERKAQKEAEKQEKTNKEKEALKEAFENELMIFGDEIFASVNYRLIHTIGAMISEKDNLICVYSTRYTWQFKYAGIEYKDTYAIRNVLREAGFTWDDENKQWQIEYSDENVEKTIEILRKYDTKSEPYKLGLAQCWECGTWNPVNKMTIDGGGYYCGC